MTRAWVLLLPMFFLTVSVAGGQSRDWHTGWEKIVKAAKAEREVAVGCEPAVDNQNALMEFSKAYPDIQLKISPIGARDFANRVMAERRAERYLADVFSGGSTSPTQVLVPAKALDPMRPALILPEVADESFWFRKKFHFADRENQYVFLSAGAVINDVVVYNTKLVRPDELRSFWDLTNPKWKGKIAAYDPRLPGGASNDMRFLYYNPRLGPKFIQKLFGEMEVVIAADRRQVMDWLATGKYAIALFASREVDTAKRQGLPVDELTSLKAEGSHLSSGAGSIALINRAPHPNAARVFINWFLSRKGQTAWQKNTDRNSLRTDIHKESLTGWKEQVPQEDGDYIFTNLAAYDDLTPGRKIVEEVLKETGKLRSGAPGAGGVQSPR
jgi:iron(III) transport system substrate-binding protein